MPPTINVYFDCIGEHSFISGIDNRINHLPLYMQEKIRSFHRKEDACLSLLGKLLLLHGLKETGASQKDLQALKYTAYNRPYFEGGPHFSISHSGRYAICAVSDECEVGIDIEQVRAIPLEDFQDLWTPRESGIIQHPANNTMDTFFYFWTRKESVIKADGRGLSIALTDFEVIDAQVVIDKKNWYLQQIEIAPGYKSHIALNSSIPAKITAKHVRIFQDLVLPEQ